MPHDPNSRRAGFLCSLRQFVRGLFSPAEAPQRRRRRLAVERMETRAMLTTINDLSLLVDPHVYEGGTAHFWISTGMPPSSVLSIDVEVIASSPAHSNHTPSVSNISIATDTSLVHFPVTIPQDSVIEADYQLTLRVTHLNGQAVNKEVFTTVIDDDGSAGGSGGSAGGGGSMGGGGGGGSEGGQGGSQGGGGSAGGGGSTSGGGGGSAGGGGSTSDGGGGGSQGGTGGSTSGGGEGSCGGSGSGGGSASGSGASISVVSYDTIIVNDDDDDDNGVLDFQQSFSSEDDELAPVLIAVTSGDLDITAFEVEIQISGSIALWQNSKGDPIAPGSRFPANQLPTVWVEGHEEGVAEIIARMIDLASGNVITQSSWSLEITTMVIRRDGNTEISASGSPSDVWVGELMDLQVIAPNITHTQWSGIDQSDTFAHWGAANGAGATTSFAKTYELTAGDLASSRVSFHWDSPGARKVSVEIRRIDTLFGEVRTTRRFARFNVKSPSASFFSVTDTIKVYESAIGVSTIQFGKTLGPPNDPPVAGIAFGSILDNSAGGTYQVVQLVNTVEVAEWEDRIRVLDTEDYVLDDLGDDGQYRYPHEEHNIDGETMLAANDSPYTDAPVASQEGLKSDNRSGDFKTYLMWKSNKDGAEWVTIRLIAWHVTWNANWDSGDQKWVLTASGHSTNPLSTVSNEHPEWSAKIHDFSFEDA